MALLTVVAAKGLVLGVLFVLTFGLGLIPVKMMTVIQRSAANSVDDTIRRIRMVTYKRVLSFLSCYAAGVFLATCFLDLLPGVRRHLITVLYAMNINTGFPVAEFIMSMGLFLILIVEQIVLSTKERGVPKSDVKQPLLSKHGEDSERDGHVEFLQSDNSITGISDQPRVQAIESVSSDDHPSRNDGGHSYSGHDDMHHHGSSHHDHHHDVDFYSHSPLRVLLLIMALSLHSIFEGLAVGLQPDSGNVLGIFAALVLHKSILSFSIGMNLVQSRLSTKTCIRAILFFSVTAPIGVAIGILITDLWDSVRANLADGILQGIACGTFLYMTFFEVLPPEFNNSQDRLLKLMMLLLGYSTVTGILFLSDDVKKPFCKITPGDG